MKLFQYPVHKVRNYLDCNLEPDLYCEILSCVNILDSDLDNLNPDIRWFEM